jgi:hypothetical protein
MKDVSISGRRIRTELRWLAISFALAILFNIYSVIKFKTPLYELVTSLHIVLLLSLIIYVLLLFFRGLASLVIRLASGKKKK